MIHILLEILQNISIQENSIFINSILEFFGKFTDTDILMMEFGIGFIWFLFFLYGLLFSKYIKYKGKKGNAEKNYTDYLEDNGLELFLYGFFALLIIFGIAIRGIGIDIILSLIFVFSSEDNGSSIGLLLNTYDNSGVVYQYYLYGRNIIFWIIVIFGVFSYSKYKSYGDAQYYTHTKNAIIATSVMLIFLYSSLMPTIINYISEKFTGGTFQEYFENDSNKEKL